MRYVSWIITLPLAVAAVVFATANRQSVVIDLWPLEQTAELHLYLVVLATFVVGFVAGGCVMWIAFGNLRDRARRARFRGDDLERELAFAQKQLARAMEASQPAPAPARANLPAASPGR